mmetsp:Transcript_12441/g.13646  ORF Transcript_12441/g.13646 Transcript_12441/m.13646 type:complete len:88 (+) Transcript_12441:1835-2098(+)
MKMITITHKNIQLGNRYSNSRGNNNKKKDEEKKKYPQKERQTVNQDDHNDSKLKYHRYPLVRRSRSVSTIQLFCCYTIRWMHYITIK